MGYSSKGKRPMEVASKSSHSHVILDPSVQSFLKSCRLPKKADDIEVQDDSVVGPDGDSTSTIKSVIAIDGGYTEVTVEADFPSSKLAFFQFGALIFTMQDLESMDEARFIDPEDMSRLRNIQRLKLSLPIKNISIEGEKTLTHSVRRALHDFFNQDVGDGSLSESLKWLIFAEYDASPAEVYMPGPRIVAKASPRLWEPDTPPSAR